MAFISPLIPRERLIPRRLQWAFIGTIAVMMGVGLAAAYRTLTFARATSHVEHTYEVLESLDTVMSLLRDAETGQRGYIITADEAYLGPYDAAAPVIAREIEHLRSLAGVNGVQLEQVAALEKLANAKLYELDNTIRMQRSGGHEAAVARIRQNVGKQYMDDARAVAGRMRAAEQDLLKQRSGAAATARTSSYVFAAGSMASAVAVALLALLVARQFEARRQALQREMADRRQTEAALGIANERLYVAVKNLPIMVYATDSAGRYTWVHNPPSGVRAEDLLGRTDLEVFTGAGATELAAMKRRVLSSGKGERKTLALPVAGRKDFYEVTAEPVLDGSGKVLGLTVAAFDLTETLRTQAELRESEERFRAIADSTPHIVWSARPDGYHDYFNARWHEFTGMPPQDQEAARTTPEVAGKGPWKDYLHPADVDATRGQWHEALQTGGAYNVEYRLRRKDGAYRWFMARALPLHDADGKVTRWFGTCSDIDDQKRAVAEREAVLAAERVARSNAERAVRMKDEFVATLSHELRTPLNAILGWAHILRRNRTPETMDKAVDTIERNARVQAQMVEDLLDTSRILSGKLRLEVQRTDVGQVIEAALASVQPAADAKGIRINTVYGSAGPIQGDPNRLQQIIWNLLTNAIKFTPKGGRVHVSHRKSGSHVEVTISDTGQGIKPAFLPHVFERFRQEDSSTTRRTSGLGLGLAIVKHLVEMHGGAIDAFSAGEGQGSTFTIRLPLAIVMQPQPAGAENIPSARTLSDQGDVLRGVAILVLDDEPDAREVVMRVLQDAGAVVTPASSAREALDILRAAASPPPAVIVSDIGMPDHDGYEFIRQVRQLPDGAGQVPAAALTALARSEDRTRALMAGFQTHISKPVDPTELIAVVASLAGRIGRS